MLTQPPLKGFEPRGGNLTRIHSRTNREVREILQLIQQGSGELQELYNESHSLAGCKRHDETAEEFEDLIFSCWDIDDLAKTKQLLQQALDKITALEERIIERGDTKPVDKASEDLKRRLAQQESVSNDRNTINM